MTMGCNCGKKKRPHGPKPEQSFVLMMRDGKTQHFVRRLDAEAARVRAGGGDIKVSRK